jgi:predicted ABC-type ATPase
VTNEERPVLMVIAGPNGAGKTTVTERLRKDRWSAGVEYINPDEVARDRFGDWNSPEAVIQAANWAAERREQLFAARAGIAFETVFSAPDKLDFAARAVEAGYFVRVFFVGTESPTINAARVAQRVMKGGHTVPIEKIISRYSRSMAQLAAVVPLAHRVYVYDNSRDGEDARLCVRCVEGSVRKVYGDLPRWIADSLADVPRHPDYEDLRA